MDKPTPPENETVRIGGITEMQALVAVAVAGVYWLFWLGTQLPSWIAGATMVVSMVVWLLALFRLGKKHIYRDDDRRDP